MAVFYVVHKDNLINELKEIFVGMSILTYAKTYAIIKKRR